ncbi:toxin-antitoxin system YwqK family antitoxin [Hymenobacter metallicola]|uniref:Toxin-antitoxin system YwqK family antitoxin n=1 Tax=Hymenobacter metallicola TaxID=2563114 RepID=A0A4Z0PUR1_9BACT|nr:hypothetical protein E5K02_24840 [Hymenobacter metallicola]
MLPSAYPRPMLPVRSLPYLCMFGIAACSPQQEVTYYPTGEVERRALLDAEGVYDGDVTSYFRNGKVQRVLPFRHHHINGVVRWYDSSGVLSHTQTYKDGKVDGARKEYYPTGKLEYEVTMRGTRRVDTAYYYYPNGKLYQGIVYDKQGRKIDYAVYTPQGHVDTRYTRPLVLSDTTRVRAGEDYTFEIRLGNRHSNVVTVSLRPVPIGLDSMPGRVARTRYLIRRPTPGVHVVQGQICEEWARRGSDTIWTNCYPLEHTFRVVEDKQ